MYNTASFLYVNLIFSSNLQCFVQSINSFAKIIMTYFCLRIWLLLLRKSLHATAHQRFICSIPSPSCLLSLILVSQLFYFSLILSFLYLFLHFTAFCQKCSLLHFRPLLCFSFSFHTHSYFKLDIAWSSHFIKLLRLCVFLMELWLVGICIQLNWKKKGSSSRHPLY